MSSFFEELRRRNVFRVGVAYVVISWLIIQVIETVSEPLGLPEWTVAFFIVLLLAGLPLILIFSWAFELTPEGLKKTSEVAAEESVTATTGKKLNYTIIAILVLALGYSVWERQGLVEQSEQATVASDEEVTETSIGASVAVLPFVNMSADPEQEFFSDGISEELLNLLAKIPELRVPARTSSFQFKGQNVDIGQVAEQLNVEHVLEGSVRKSGVKVRITAQLIEADTGYHLWSDTYDRELTDIFAIQDEISAAIVAALSETLGIQGAVVPKTGAATVPAAYNAYLLAQHQIRQRTKLSIESAVANYETALELDPDYAPAHAGIGLAWYLLTASGATYGTLPLDESLAKAMPHLERALELDPDLPEALGAYGLTLSANLKDDEALPYFEKALGLNPSLTSVRNWYASSLQELGRPEDALGEFEKAYQLDPLSVLALNNYTNQLMIRRRFEELEPVLNRLTQIDSARGAQFRGVMEVARGKAAAGTTVMLRAIDQDATQFSMRLSVAFNLWNMGLQDAARGVWPYPDDMYPLEGNTFDRELALELALQNFAENPDQPGIKANLAWSYFNAGKNEEAFRYAGEFLDTLGEDVRPQNFTNLIFALDAWQRGDEAEMLARIDPLDASLDAALASGVEVSNLRIGKAWLLEMRGESDAALENLEKAAFRSVMNPDQMDFFYEGAGWSGRPDFEDLRRRHREYIESQRDEVLAVACGPDGFQVWQPPADDCGRKAAPPVPN
jgi:TolB-like protein/Flp pilus assembly protein TadD